MKLGNKERLLEIYNQIKPIMDNEIQWGNPLLNMLISIAIDKYKQNVDNNIKIEDLLLFVGYSGIIKIYTPIKPTPGLVGGGNNLRAIDEEDALHIITKENDKEHEYFIDELYAKLLTYKSENIVKKVCAELGISQKELAEELEIPIPTMARWSKGDIPKMTKIALELMLENKELKEKFEILKKAHKILSE